MVRTSGNFAGQTKDLHGQRVYHRRVIGTIDQYADETAVRHATLPLISEVNSRSRHDHVGSIAVDQLCEYFEQWEFRSTTSRRSVATVKTYRGYISRWIRPHWGSHQLGEIKATDVGAWLSSLHLARASRSKLRSILSNALQSCLPARIVRPQSNPVRSSRSEAAACARCVARL